MIIKDIISKYPCDSFYGNENETIENAQSLNSEIKSNKTLSWCNDKNWQVLLTKEVGTFIISEMTYLNLKKSRNSGNKNFIVTKNPRLYFSSAISFFEEQQVFEISNSAIIHPSAVIESEDVFIGENVIIEAKVVIGKGSVIGHNTVLKKGTIIRNKVQIGANCTIGGVGFGYEKDVNGKYLKIPHIGNVEIHDNVDIGNNVCIDRAVLGSTILKNNVKVDNLVHIAHGVCIDENSLIIANAMIAGSVEIGKNVWIAPSASVMQKKKVHSNSTVGLGSVVLKDVEENSIVAGVPAEKLKK